MTELEREDRSGKSSLLNLSLPLKVVTRRSGPGGTGGMRGLSHALSTSVAVALWGCDLVIVVSQNCSLGGPWFCVGVERTWAGESVSPVFNLCLAGVEAHCSVQVEQYQPSWKKF